MRSRILFATVLIAVLWISFPAAAAVAAAPGGSAGIAEPTIAAHPRELKFGELRFEPPKADAYRHKLKNGVVVYLAEDHTLPLVNVQLLVRAGAFLDTKERPGVAAMTGTMLREGGTKGLTAEQFDEKVDFLAARIASYGRNEQSGASLNAISSQLGPSLDLFFDMIRDPGFQQSRFDVEKGSALESLKQRNDDAGDILGREWAWLLYGESHFAVREMTKAEWDVLTRDDLIAFHAKYFKPENMLLAVSGDVSTKDLLADLERRFSGWKSDGPKVPWPPSPPTYAPKPGLYHVEKDIPQGKVAIGHLGIKREGWDNPDYFALTVMNDILGGGGFTSRITKRVRSDEGLAYGAGSSFGIGTYWPGAFRIGFASKNPTVAFAAKISVEEVSKIRQGEVSDDELVTSKNSFIETFPRSFESPASIVNIFAMDEYTGRPHEYWARYRDNIRKVTAANVKRVAATYLQPDKLMYLVVGKWSEIEPGDPNGKASMKDFHGGRVVHLPLRDPLTLQPMP